MIRRGLFDDHVDAFVRSPTQMSKIDAVVVAQHDLLSLCGLARLGHVHIRLILLDVVVVAGKRFVESVLGRLECDQ